MIPFLRYWFPLFVWMFIIFSASSDTQSTQRTSRLLEPILRWLNPEVSAKTIDRVRLLIRKSAHVLEYGVLSWLTWRALHRPARDEDRPWSWRTAMTSLCVVILYASTDELHQHFVPNRTGSITDICIDTAGGVLGLALIWGIYTRRRS